MSVTATETAASQRVTVEVECGCGDSHRITAPRDVIEYATWTCESCERIYQRRDRPALTIWGSGLTIGGSGSVVDSCSICRFCTDEDDYDPELDYDGDDYDLDPYYDDDPEEYVPANPAPSSRTSTPPVPRNFCYGPFDGDNEEGEYIRATRTVGVEYEMMGRGRYTEILPEVGVGSDPTANVEVRTPPAKGKAADRFTKHTLEKMLENGWRPGQAAGLHVHVHAPEFSNGRQRTVDGNKAVARFVALWLAIEPVAFRFAPERRESSWSRPLTRDMQSRLQAIDETLRILNTEEFPRGYAYERYQSANLTALDKYHTIEFRCHGSTDDVEHVMAWVAFVQAIVDLSFLVTPDAIRQLGGPVRHDTRARLLLLTLKRHGVVTKSAYESIRKVLLPSE